MMFLPANVRFILDTLESNGYEAYVVGGCVRDALMGATPLDYDITTSATPDEITALFKKTIDTGANFGTITVLLDKINYEVTTYRTETGYDDFRKPNSVAFSTDLLEDLQRRDFTINAIAYHPDRGYSDPYGGRADITNKLIKAVGNPNERFTEDALRMLRCVRFSAKLDFTIEPLTYQALLDNAPLLKNISLERVREELIKTLLSKQLQKMKTFNDTALFKAISPDLYIYFLENLEKSIPLILKAPADLEIRFTLLLQAHPNPKAPLTFLKFSKAEIKEISTLIRFLAKPIDLTNRYALKKLILDLTLPTLKKYLVLKNILGHDIIQTEAIISDIINKNDPIFLKDLKIDGKTLIANHILTPGPTLGIVLTHLHEQVLRDPALNETSTLLTLARNLAES